MTEEQNDQPTDRMASTSEIKGASLVAQGKEPTIISLIDKAVERDWTADQLAPLYKLYRQMQRDQAKVEYSAALARFQAEMPLVGKAKSAEIKMSSGGTYGYQYAGIDDIMAIASPLLAKHGIAVSFFPDKNGEMMKVTCRARKGVYFEEAVVELPIPKIGPNAAQMTAQAISYARRYALTSLLNINSVKEDNDAENLYETITDEQASHIRVLLARASRDPESKEFLDFADADCVEHIQSGRYDHVVKKIKAIIEQQEKRGGAK